MPKTHSDFPVNLTFRVSVGQRDYLDQVASLHGVTPSDYLRALLDAALVTEAKEALGVPGADDASALARARKVVLEIEEKEHG